MLATVVGAPDPEYLVFAPTTKAQYVTVQISGRRDSNSRPSAWKADALPTELLPLVGAAEGSLEI